MTSSRNSSSSHRTCQSATACNPNSSQTTPTSITFPSEPSEASNRSETSIVNHESREEEYEARNNPEDPVEGWPRVALLMAKTPDFAAFSIFRDLNIKSLLYYQAQLTTLRRELHEQEYKDSRNTNDDEFNKKFASRADLLTMSKDSEQLKLVTEIRNLLRDYNEALLQYSRVSALPEPDTYNMKSLLKWLRHTDGGDFCIEGRGEQHTWGYLYEDSEAQDFSPWKRFWQLVWALIWTQAPPSNDLDLVVTRTSPKIDGFTRWLACYFVPFYEDFSRYKEEKDAAKLDKAASTDLEKHAGKTMKKWRKRSATKGKPVNPKDWVPKAEKQPTLVTWSEKGLLRFTSSVSTVVACLLPIIAITVLSQLHGLRNLLLCIAGFAVIFALGLIFLTNGTSSRIEIFTATAAFSAVLVVFISVPVVNVSSDGVSMGEIVRRI